MRIAPLLIKTPLYLTIAANVRSPNISSLAYAAGWSGYEPIVCTINAGVDVSNLTISGIPSGILTIINRGRIGAEQGSTFGIYTRISINIDNSSGTIFGVGGDGGLGGTVRIQNPNSSSFQATGVPGAGGKGSGFSTSGTLALVAAAAGDAGTSVQVGGPTTGGSGFANGGQGGNGGAIGQAGQTGQAGFPSGNYVLLQTIPPENGKVAGNYIDGIAYVTWINTGTRLGGAI